MPQTTPQEKIDRILSMQKLFLEFEELASKLSKIIIDEVDLDNTKKTISSQHVGGVAGNVFNGTFVIIQRGR